MSKYTPGPWEALTRDEYNDLFQADEESELLATYAIVSDMNDMYGPWKIAEIIGGLGEVQVNANARLIAASPKMYQFIKDMAKGWECGTPGCCIDSPCCEVMEARALLAEIGLEEET
jgi:hypothetical protein